MSCSKEEDPMVRMHCVLALASSLAFVALAPAQIYEFTVPLDGGQEVPPNSSRGRGHATVVLDRTTGQVTITGEYQGLSTPITAAHIHAPAPRGENAGVILPLTHTGGTTGTLTGNGVLTPAQVGQIQTELGYVNVHSQMFGGGEIRGQIERFFWKGGRKSPMYDFDQKKNPAWGANGVFSWCGPVALANSICWYDENVCPGLVPANLKDPVTGKTIPEKLIEEIACNWLPAGKPGQNGVSCADLQRAAQRYVERYKPKFFEVHDVPANDYQRICWELRRSQDVIVLVGFYEQDIFGRIVRNGGHFLTLAGCSTDQFRPAFAFADPYWDSHAVGATRGRSNGPNGDSRDPTNNPCNHMDVANVPDSGSPGASPVQVTGQAVPGGVLTLTCPPCPSPTARPFVLIGLPPINICTVTFIPPPLSCVRPFTNLGIDSIIPPLALAGPTATVPIPPTLIGDLAVQCLCADGTRGCIDLSVAVSIAIRP
jgi:hypothetical protein